MVTCKLAKLETMMGDRIIKHCHLTCSSFWVRASGVIRLPRRSRAKAGHSCFVVSSALILVLMSNVSSAQSPNLIGRWNVEITFANDEHRSVRFEAQPDGKGSLLLLDAKMNVWEPAKPSEAKWNRGEGNAVTFSGPMKFMIGNVGRDAGTLAFKGKFETTDLITGEVEFSPLVGERPSKHGTFRATRVSG